MIFKRCKEEDLPLIREVMADSFSTYFYNVNPTVEELKEHFESISINYPLSIIMYMDNGPAGLAVCGARGQTVHLGPMGVITKYQGHGYGKELLKKTIALAKEAGFKKMVLEVACDNTAACGLYKSTGFKTTRKLKRFQYFNIMPEGVDPSFTTVKKEPGEILKCFNEFHKNENPSWLCAYETVEETKSDFGLTVHKGEEVLGYALCKDTKIVDIAAEEFEPFKALINAVFEKSSYLFILDLPEEDIRVKYFKELGFIEFLEHYEMEYAL
ncbi:MAG: GNAT family N-acetyltransferase [Armatimonadota bacterium]